MLQLMPLLVLAAAIDSFLDILLGSLVWITSIIRDHTRPWDYPAGKSRFEPLGMIVFSSVMFSATLQLLLEGIKVCIFDFLIRGNVPRTHIAKILRK